MYVYNCTCTYVCIVCRQMSYQSSIGRQMINLSIHPCTHHLAPHLLPSCHPSVLLSTIYLFICGSSVHLSIRLSAERQTGLDGTRMCPIKQGLKVCPSWGLNKRWRNPLTLCWNPGQSHGMGTWRVWAVPNFSIFKRVISKRIWQVFARLYPQSLSSGFLKINLTVRNNEIMLKTKTKLRKQPGSRHLAVQCHIYFWLCCIRGLTSPSILVRTLYSLWGFLQSGGTRVSGNRLSLSDSALGPSDSEAPPSGLLPTGRSPQSLCHLRSPRTDRAVPLPSPSLGRGGGRVEYFCAHMCTHICVETDERQTDRYRCVYLPLCDVYWRCTWLRETPSLSISGPHVSCFYFSRPWVTVAATTQCVCDGLSRAQDPHSPPDKWANQNYSKTISKKKILWSNKNLRNVCLIHWSNVMFCCYMFSPQEKQEQKHSNTKFGNTHVSETVTMWCTLNANFTHWYNFRFGASFWNTNDNWESCGAHPCYCHLQGLGYIKMIR